MLSASSIVAAPVPCQEADLVTQSNGLRPDIVWLGDPACHDVRLTGAKAAHLSRLAAVQRVPPGFSITSDALSTAVIGEQFLPLELRGTIAEAYLELTRRTGNPTLGVAVRSSAVDEDGPTASFAGQHDTYLNVSGVGEVIDAVERCWASARCETVLAYRRSHGLSLDDIRISVLIQQLVVADTSAVVFSANPVSGRRDELIVCGSWGLGESIVGGSVTPDHWTLRREGLDLEIIERRVSSKARMTVAVPGGTREVDVPRIVRLLPSLDDGQIFEIARLALTLEAEMGWPTDVECAVAGGELYLLQCRPITTLGIGSLATTEVSDSRQELRVLSS